MVLSIDPGPVWASLCICEIVGYCTTIIIALLSALCYRIAAEPRTTDLIRHLLVAVSGLILSTLLTFRVSNWAFLSRASRLWNADPPLLLSSIIWSGLVLVSVPCPTGQSSFQIRLEVGVDTLCRIVLRVQCIIFGLGSVYIALLAHQLMIVVIHVHILRALHTYGKYYLRVCGSS